MNGFRWVTTVSVVLAAVGGARAEPDDDSRPPVASELNVTFADTLLVPAHLVVPADSLLLGAPFDVGVIWLTPKPVSNLILITPPAALDPLELVDVERGLDRGDTMTARVTLRAFDVGWVGVPALTWAGITEDDVLVLAESGHDSVIVASVVPDGAEGLLDIYEAFPMTGGRAWWWWAAAGAALALLGAVLWWRRRRVDTGPVDRADVPSHEVALAALEGLRRDPRGKSGPWKPFYTDLTDTLRHYVSRRYGIPAPDYTTHETMRALAALGLPNRSLDDLGGVLGVADAIKFAKATPSSSAGDEDVERAIRFVKATVPPPPVDTPEPSPQTEGAGA